jgi:hypothetical protein
MASKNERIAINAAGPGAVIAFYQLGYGIAAFGVGPLQHAGVSLWRIFGFTAIIAGATGVLSFFVTRSRSKPGAAAAVPGPRRPASAARALGSDRPGARREG